MSGYWIRFACALLMVTAAHTASAKSADTKSDGPFLRLTGFGMNYGLVSNSDTLPNPPEFHLGLDVPSVVTASIGDSSANAKVASYLQKTIEQVFGQLVGTAEPETPFTVPSYHLTDRLAH